MTGDQFKRLLAECNLTAGQMAKRLSTNHARVFYVMKYGLDSRSVMPSKPLTEKQIIDALESNDLVDGESK